MKTLLLAGGGTGGHIYPAIAIAQAFRSKYPASRIVFVGTAKGLETKLDNPGYVANAPAAVVTETRERLVDAQTQMKRLSEQLAALT